MVSVVPHLQVQSMEKEIKVKNVQKKILLLVQCVSQHASLRGYEEQTNVRPCEIWKFWNSLKSVI